MGTAQKASHETPLAHHGLLDIHEMKFRGAWGGRNRVERFKEAMSPKTEMEKSQWESLFSSGFLSLPFIPAMPPCPTPLHSESAESPQTLGF